MSESGAYLRGRLVLAALDMGLGLKAAGDLVR